MMNANPQAAQHMSFKQKLKRWVGKHPVIARILLLVLVWKAFWWFYGFAIINPNPKDAIIVKGRFPFNQGYDLFFKSRGTVGEAKWHYHLCPSYLLQSKSARCSANVEPMPLEVNKPSPNQYEITLYEDYYLRGLQQWSNTVFDAWLHKKQGHHPDWKTIPLGSRVPSYSYTGAPFICDDSEAGLMKSKGALWCMLQYDDRDRKHGNLRYKHLQLPATPSSGNPKESVVDFWLYSELEEMLKEPGNAPPPAPTNPPPTKQ